MAKTKANELLAGVPLFVPKTQYYTYNLKSKNFSL